MIFFTINDKECYFGNANKKKTSLQSRKQDKKWNL